MKKFTTQVFQGAKAFLNLAIASLERLKIDLSQKVRSPKMQTITRPKLCNALSETGKWLQPRL